MHWTIEKLQARIHELSAYRYRDSFSIATVYGKEDPVGQIGEYPNDEGDWSAFCIGDSWRGYDKYLWLRMEADIPAEWKDKLVVCRFRFGAGGGGNNDGFEALLFMNNEAYQGIDTNHEEVFIPESLVGKHVRFDFRLWSGLTGYRPVGEVEHKLQMAAIGWLDAATDDLYYSALAVIETVKLLGDRDPVYHELLAAADRAFLRVDWSSPGSDDFYGSVAEAGALLQDQLLAMPKAAAIVVNCVGHTHIDVAWLWRLKHTREKTARSFSTVLRLMEMYPEYIFLQTQPQLYEYIKEDYPRIYEQIQRRIAEGRWEAGGAMWLEADCNLTSGESLVRQILYGKRFFKKEFGADCRYLWLPDVFGYSWALPQIMVKSGISTFMTTKISWNQYNRMPHDTFHWRGIDGSTVLTHFITTPDPGSKEGSFFYTYNGKVTPQSVQGIWDSYRDKSINKELLLCYGYGDGGGGVDREMLEMRRRVDSMPGLPYARSGRADEYFEGLERRMADTDQYIHTWDGELYLELHRGTYTSQAYNKRMNRKLELLYREAEWLQTFASVAAGDWSEYAQNLLYEGWKIILRNQFHDIIPGSSIREVYADCREEYAEAKRIGDLAWAQAASSLTEQAQESTGWTVYNSSSWTYSGLVNIPMSVSRRDIDWFDEYGDKLEAQACEDEWVVNMKDVPALGACGIRYRRRQSEAEPSLEQDDACPFEITENRIATPFYELIWNANGQWVRLYDREHRREVLADGAKGNVLQVFEDKPKSRHEAWDIDIYYQQKMREIDRLISVKLVEKGPLLATIRFEWRYGSTGDTHISQDVTLYANNRRIDCSTKADWHEQRQLLKVAFPVRVRAVEATYDIQFGNVKRPTHWNTSWDWARFETVGHQWADLSERGYGVSLLNDCKYGYDIKDNILRLSLIKSAIVPDDKADQGEHLFTYSLMPHAGGWYEGDTVREAWMLNHPLAVSRGLPRAAKRSLFRLSAGHVMIDSVKKAEDDHSAILRLHEYAGIRAELQIESDYHIVEWQECNLMEEPHGEISKEPVIRLSIEPYEIRTMRVLLKGVIEDG